MTEYKKLWIVRASSIQMNKLFDTTKVTEKVNSAALSLSPQWILIRKISIRKYQKRTRIDFRKFFALFLENPPNIEIH
jgi:acyl-ACP thioesterase